MPSNIDRFKQDIKSLTERGDMLIWAMLRMCRPDTFRKQMEQVFGKDRSKEMKAAIEAMPDFRKEYESWYSEAKVAVKQLLPDRLLDFVAHYQPKSRKVLDAESYRILDCLQGLSSSRESSRGKEIVVGPEAAIPHFDQQLAIVKAASRRFDSSLFDIRQLVQADVFDTELDSAEHLVANGFARAAGALAGVVLERHLQQVCDNHSITLKKKVATIAPLYDALKDANVIDVPTWRSIQHLADIRNLCDHSKATEPSADQARDLIAGVKKVLKTLF